MRTNESGIRATGRRRWSTVLVTLLFVAVGGALAGCDAALGDEQGVWCREDGAALKFLFLDGIDRYTVKGRDESANVTTVVDDEAYEMVEEEGLTYWHSWVGGAEYANEVTTLTPAEELVLDSSLFYSFVADHDLAHDIAGIEECVSD